MKNRLLLLAALFSVLVAPVALSANRVLYVTHEPGRWHEYTPQLASFREIAKEAQWELTVATGSVEETLAYLGAAEFSFGQDAIVYNFCLADSSDLAAMSNLIKQTEEYGVPALLLHCSMHSWWSTYKKGKPIPGNTVGKARANKKLLKTWQKANPDSPLPAWGDFTGVASTGHGRQKPIEVTASGDHPVTADLPPGYNTAKTELYNNHYLTDGVIPLAIGRQDKDEAIIMWLAPRGKGQLMGLTLGHGADEWSDPVFRSLLKKRRELPAGEPMSSIIEPASPLFGLRRRPTIALHRDMAILQPLDRKMIR